MKQNESVVCLLCGHTFHSGVVEGYVYCPSCGRRFHQHFSGEDTIVVPAPPKSSGTSASGRTGGALESVTVSTSNPFSFDEDGDAPVSRRFGDYDILDEIARGGMGVVYLARQRVLRRVVALKVLRSGDNASEEERERLLREAKAAAGLSHPNIVPIHEFSIHQGQPYFTMDYIDGEPLDLMLERGPLHVRQAVDIIAVVSRAIAYAHTRGIIHRDLKPANIIITPDGRPMITDFGLAVEQSAESEKQLRMTMAGSVMGTIPYAPPEQAAGKIDQITERSDVYAMGAVLYEMVTGRPPFTGFTQFELMRRVINHDPAPPRQLNPKVHRDVETIIMKCLEKEQRRRYSSAKAFADDCQSFLKGEVIAARPITLGYRCRRFITRRPLLNVLGMLVLFLLLAVWVGINHFNALAKEKAQTELKLEHKEAETERITLEKEEIERQVRRDWRTEYNINFDHYFRFEYDLEKAHRMGIPWLNPENLRTGPEEPVRVKFGIDPQSLMLSDPEGAGAGPETPLAGHTDLGLPFLFPREARVSLRVKAPPGNVGELVMSLDVDTEYSANLGTTTVRFGSPTRPGIFFYRSGTVIGEDPVFTLKAGQTSELAVERSDNRLRAYQDGKLVLDVSDPPPVFNNTTGRIALDVKDGALEFLDLAVDLRGMSRNLASSLIETADAMAARGRSELAYRLYTSVLLEPTDAQNRLKAIRGFARSVWLTLPRKERNHVGVQRACGELEKQMASAGLLQPGQIDYLIGSVLSTNQSDIVMAREHLDKAKSAAYSSDPSVFSPEFGDLAKLETVFVNLRRGELDEAARSFRILFEDGTMTRLYERFGAELGGGGQVALLLEKADSLISDGVELDTAGTLLRAAAAIVPSSRETSSHFRRLGLVYSGLSQVSRAVEYMHWAERLSPDWFRPYLDEAWIHFGNGDSGLAADTLRRASEAIPQSLDLHLGISKMYLDELPVHLRDPSRAEVAARTAVTLSQGMNPVALELLSKSLFRLGRLGEAMRLINQALSIEVSASRIGLRDTISLEILKE